MSCLTELLRCSTGVGSTIGAGIYVLVGTVAREHAGPALTLSFLIAGIAAALSALCYAELSCRFPLAGSAYHYSYICIGERQNTTVLLLPPHSLILSLCPIYFHLNFLFYFLLTNYDQCRLVDWLGSDSGVHNWWVISGSWHFSELGNTPYKALFRCMNR